MIKTANQRLAENRPELKAKLDPCWDSIVERTAGRNTVAHAVS
jgi:hypothetical protein